MTRRSLIALMLGLAPLGAAAAPLAGREVPDDVFYQFMPIAWRDGNGDAYRYGDFAGMTDSLDYLADLGVTAVWMNPIFPSAAYHGYQHGAGDQLNPWFGTEADFLAFVSAAHARDIKVFVDYVVYGISQNSPWYQSAYNNPASPYDAWLAFTNSGNTQYLGSVYSTWSGASVGFIHWNLDNPNPTALVTGWTQHWLDPDGDGDPSDGIDGYRLDHVWNQYPSGPNGWGYNIAWWENWNAALESVKADVFIFAEQADWATTGSNLLSAFDAAFTKPFEFAARDALAAENASGLYASMAATLADLPAGKQFMGIIGDHDVDRLASVIGDSLAKGRAAAAVLLTQPFTPIIYYGDEIGMRGTKASYGSDANDIPMREPFKWNAVAGPPMSNYWIRNASAYNNRVARDNDGRSVEEQAGVSGSLLEEYRTLIAARRDNAALRRGAYRAVTNTSTAVWSFLRYLDGGQTLLVAINVSGATRSLTLDLSQLTFAGGLATVHDAIGGAAATPVTVANRAHWPLTLPAYGYAVLEIAAEVEPAAPQVVDGLNIPADLGPAALRATQNNATGFGDNQSELNQLYIDVAESQLRIGLTGNLATDGTGLALFLDTLAGGQGTLATSSFPQPPAGIPQISGLVFDAGFAPDYVLFVNAYSGNIYADYYTLASGGGGSKRYLGSGTVGDGDGFLSGGSNPSGLQVALDNRNTAGVTATSPAGAAGATSGFEIILPFADAGITAGTESVRMLAMLLRSNGQVSNQLLPGLGGGYTNLGLVPLNLGDIPGAQFLTLGLIDQPGDWDGDGDVDLHDYAQFTACFTGPAGGGALGPGCSAFDFDADLDVDLLDAAELCRHLGP